MVDLNSLQKRQFFFCDCDAHAIEVSEFTDEPREIYINLWRQGVFVDGWRERIRQAWFALRGEQFADNATISPLTAKALGQYLVSLAAIPDTVITSTGN